MLYNVPSRAGVNMDATLISRLAGIRNIVGVKEASGNVAQMAVSRGEHLPDGGTRLAAENPVFVAWGERAPKADA